MSELYPTACRAELKAIGDALRIALPPLTLHTDNGLVVLVWKRGRQWRCSSQRDGADLWREFWDRIADLGEDIRIKKVKAHLPSPPY